MTGMREQEVMHCYWSDINFAASTVVGQDYPARLDEKRIYLALPDGKTCHGRIASVREAGK